LQRSIDDGGIFAALHAPRRAHRFQGLMIKLSRIVCSRAGGESISIHAVKQNIELSSIIMSDLSHGLRLCSR
jgi:hypothetical protein